MKNWIHVIPLLWVGFSSAVSNAYICAHYLDRHIDKGCLVAKYPQAKLIDRSVDHLLRDMLSDVPERQKERALNFVTRIAFRAQGEINQIQRDELSLSSALRSHPLSWIIIPHETRHFMDRGYRAAAIETLSSFVHPNLLRERESRAARLDYRLARKLLSTPGFNSERALTEFPRRQAPARLYDLHQIPDESFLKDLNLNDLSEEGRRELEANCLKRADLAFRRLMYFANCLSEDEYVEMHLKPFRRNIDWRQNTAIGTLAATGSALSAALLHFAHFF